MSFVERMKKVINQGLETTKSVVTKAAEKAKELGEKGVLKYEITQLENQVEKRFALIGNAVYELLMEKEKNTVSKSTPEIKNLLAEIKGLEQKIEEKEAAYKKIGN